MVVDFSHILICLSNLLMSSIWMFLAHHFNMYTIEIFIIFGSGMYLIIMYIYAVIALPRRIQTLG